MQSVLIQALPKRLVAHKGEPSILSGGEVILSKSSKQCNARQSPQEEIQLTTLLEFCGLETSWHLASDDSKGLLFFMQTHRADK